MYQEYMLVDIFIAYGKVLTKMYVYVLFIALDSCIVCSKFLISDFCMDEATFHKYNVQTQLYVNNVHTSGTLYREEQTTL